MSDATQSTEAWLEFIAAARTAALTTLGPDGRMAAVPICFVLIEARGIDPAIETTVLYSPLDEKPKRSADPRHLRRVRNLAANPQASLLVSRWDEDWARLAFVHLDVSGTLLEPDAAEHGRALAALRAKYHQYADHDLESRPILRFAIQAIHPWAAGRDAPDPPVRTAGPPEPD